MINARNKIRRAIFDVKPVNKNGDVDLKKIASVTGEINLRVQRESNNNFPDIESILVGINHHDPSNRLEAEPDNYDNHFDLVINRHIGDPERELAKIGAVVSPSTVGGRYIKQARTIVIPKAQIPSVRLILDTEPPEENNDQYKDILEKMREPIPEGPSLPQTEKNEPFQDKSDVYYGEYKKGSSSEVPIRPEGRLQAVRMSSKIKRTWRFKGKWGFFIIPLILIPLYFAGVGMKDRIIEGGNSAISDLEKAEGNLKNFKFAAASDNFNSAYNNFNSTGDELKIMDTGLGSIISSLPGGGKLRSANDLIEAGQAIAESGKAVSDAVATLSKTSSLLNPSLKDGSAVQLIRTLRSALFVSKTNIARAQDLLASIDESVIPQDKRPDFIKFKDKIPLMVKNIDDAMAYSSFLESLLGVNKQKTYLLLFQNHSELRPTGGFPGTYGIVTFENGKLKDFSINDVYNLDGQLKQNIVPPVQLQHITPVWGMRDANWFIDYPTSAKKIEWFYKQESGQDVDGVIAIGPEIISDIIDILGPVDMPEYNTTINGDNFLATIQSEVEYGKDRTKPKQILIDLAPKLLQKIYSAQPKQWLSIFDTILTGLDAKNILMSFNDLDLRTFALERGFSGEVKQVNGDYLAVNFTNVKGSKTDIVTDSFVKLDTALEGDKAVHKLVITRKHNGGGTEYGFYNRQNPAYVRVLVPKGSKLVSINGASAPNYQPLISYGKSFERDPDLAKFESSFVNDNMDNVSTFEESGKTGFGFWLIVDPGKTASVELKYEVPLSETGRYDLYVQKQPGIDLGKFEWSLSDPNSRIASVGSNVNKTGDVYSVNRKLDSDLSISIKLN